MFQTALLKEKPDTLVILIKYILNLLLVEQRGKIDTVKLYLWCETWMPRIPALFFISGNCIIPENKSQLYRCSYVATIINIQNIFLIKNYSKYVSVVLHLLCTVVFIADLLPSKMRCQAVIYLYVYLNNLNIDVIEKMYHFSSGIHCQFC